jgi:hypothetical protein
MLRPASRKGGVPARFYLLLLLLGPLAPSAHAELVRVIHAEGSAHGFVEVTTGDGKRVAVGDLLRSSHGNLVRSQLVLRFLDGSVDDETTVYEQRAFFRLLSDHHVQKGPTFPSPVDVTIDTRARTITTIDPQGAATSLHLDMPRDAYNGLLITALMNMPPSTPEKKIALIVAGDKPRIVHLSLSSGGQVAFTIGGEPRMATDYRVHVEIGGIAGVVAPLVGKQPVDYHVWLLPGEAPAFIREEGPLFQGGPVLRIQQISAQFPN